MVDSDVGLDEFQLTRLFEEHVVVRDLGHELSPEQSLQFEDFVGLAPDIETILLLVDRANAHTAQLVVQALHQQNVKVLRHRQACPEKLCAEQSLRKVVGRNHILVRAQIAGLRRSPRLPFAQHHTKALVRVTLRGLQWGCQWRLRVW